MLAAKISQEFKNSGISTSSILIRLSHLEIHILFQSSTSKSESFLGIIVLPSLVYLYFELAIEQDEIKQKTDK